MTENTLAVIKLNNFQIIASDFTGIVIRPSENKYWYKEGRFHREDGPAWEHANGSRLWYKEGKRHRLDGPAVEHKDGSKSWYLEDNFYPQININDYVVLDHCKGKFGIMWYKLLDKISIFEYPDIPGLITKE